MNASSVKIFFLVRVISTPAVSAGDRSFTNIKGGDPASSSTRAATVRIGASGKIVDVAGLGTPFFTSDYDWRFAGFTTPQAIADGGDLVTRPDLSETVTYYSFTIPIAENLSFFISNMPPDGLVFVRSEDGQHWALNPLTLFHNWYELIWISELGIFVGQSLDLRYTGYFGPVATSPDGVSWTVRDIQATPQALAWAKTPQRIFSITGFNPSISYSDDGGLTWAVGHTISSFCNNVSAAWSEELQTLVVIGGNASATSLGVVFSSPAIRTWTPTGGWVVVPSVTNFPKYINNPAAVFHQYFVIAALAWSPSLGIFVAVGGEDSPETLPVGGFDVATSTDGVTWASVTRSSDRNRQYWRAVVWSEEAQIFVAVARDAVFPTTNYLMWSENGIDWVTENVGFAPASLIWAKELNKFIATETIGTRSIYSADGKTWSEGEPLGGGVTFQNVGRSSTVWSPELGFMLSNIAKTANFGISWDTIPVDGQTIVYELDLLPGQTTDPCMNPFQILVLNFHDLSGCPGGQGVITAVINGGDPVVVGIVPAGSPYAPGEVIVTVNVCPGDAVQLKVDCYPLPPLTVPADIPNALPPTRVRPPTNSDFNNLPTPLPPPAPATPSSECGVPFLYDYEIGTPHVE